MAIIIFIVACFGTGLYFLRLNSQGHFYLAAQGGNATVRLSSFYLGDAPIKDYKLPPGWYQLHLRTDYYDYTVPIRLVAKTATIVDWHLGDSLAHSSGIIYELIPAPKNSTLLTVTTSPEKALITVDQGEAVSAPIIEQALTPGDHQLQIVLPGFQTLIVPFTLTPGYQLKLTVKLAQESI